MTANTPPASGPAKTDDAAKAAEKAKAEAAKASPGQVAAAKVEQKQVKENAEAAKKDLLAAPPVPVSSQYGTNPDVLAQGEAVKAQNSQADLAGGSYATTGLAAPLTPSDQHTQVVPFLGDPASSTSHISTSAGMLTQAGEQHIALLDEEGNELGPDDIFEDLGAEKTFVIVKSRVMEQYRFPNTTEVTTRLFYNKGRRVPRGEAARLQTSLRLQAQHGL